MAFVPPIPPEKATGVTAREFEKAMRRAGRVWGIVAIQSHNGEALRESMRMYATVMFGDSPLSRAQREMIAVVTSKVNACVY
jgi:alkylhydroperoxidase family enzyme